MPVAALTGLALSAAVVAATAGAAPPGTRAHRTAPEFRLLRRAMTSGWDQPALVDPTTVVLTPSSRSLKLSQSQDYIVQCPPGPFDVSGKITIWGGHNVVLQDCNEYVTAPDWAGYLEDQTGTLWVHDVHFGGRHLTGGIQLQEPVATVVMRDVLFDRVHGSYRTNHADCVQTWAGPIRLLIDGLDCPTDYQGLFLLPNQWDRGRRPRLFDLRHIYVDDSRGGVALWLGDVKGGLSKMRLNVQDVYVTPNPRRRWRGWWLWPHPPARTWSRVTAGTPPAGGYVEPTPWGATGVDENATSLAARRHERRGRRPGLATRGPTSALSSPR